MQKSLTVLFVLFAFLTYADSPNHIIAILENERKLDAEPDVKLSSFFKSKDASIRSRAILAAGRIGNPAILTALQPLEKDPNTEVRIELALHWGRFVRAKDCQ